MKNKKAQVWAIDLSIALIIFIGVIFLFYRYSISFAPENYVLNKMIAEGGYASNMLLSTGFPPTWNQGTLDNAFSIGILNDNGLLDPVKLNQLRTWASNPTNYESIKKKINTKYNYYIEFSPIAFQPIGHDYSTANPSPKQIVKIQRLIAYQDTNEIKTAKLILYLWTDKDA